MFLNKNNTFRWKWFSISAAAIALLCTIGVLWLDVPLFFFLRRFNGAAPQVIDTIFSFKSWVIATGATLAVVLAIKFIKTKAYSIDKIKKLLKTPKVFNLIRVFSAVVMAGVIGGALKFAIGRMRPVFLETLGQTGFYPFTNEWAFNSMPSGHATASFAGLVMIGLLNPKWKWLTWTLAIVIGVSRIAIGDHFPSDVLLGAFIGMVCADFVRSRLH